MPHGAPYSEGREASVSDTGRVADAGMLVSLNGNHEMVNGNAEFFRALGTSADELCGRRFDELLTPGLRAPVVHHLTQLLNGTNDHFTTLIALSRPDGPPLAATLSATAVRGGGPSTERAVLTLQPEGGSGSPSGNSLFGLSETDARILEGIAAGTTSEVLASQLFVSRQTVEYRIGGLLRKLGVSNRVALVSRSYASGLLCQISWPPRIMDGVVAQPRRRTPARSSRSVRV